MTIGRGREQPLPRDDDRQSHHADRHSTFDEPNNAPDERKEGDDERRPGAPTGHDLVALLRRALNGWGTTARLIAIMIAVLAVLLVGAGMFKLTIDIGFVHLTGR